ncbi:carboxypeptidase-like regulatory domain-containing protein [Flavobacterium sp. LS2P90]|uniref:Carboxypeptidase-like regulatory domain-containing protein n=1 Tax=Flavobacterium xylosi TaxID=3230415 RepID=A0ABW6HSC5_9FLAO
MTRAVCVFFILMATKALAQEPIPENLNGKIIASLSNLEGIHVFNLKTKKAVITDNEGRFSISATVGDTLIFSAVQFKTKRVGLTSEYFEQDLFYVTMTPIVNQLQEVIVKKQANINAESLGIISNGQKKYTQAERKLKTAGDFKPINLLGLLGGSLAGDQIINKINGKTAMLKKEIEVEKKESYLNQLDNLFDIDYSVNKLKIPSEYVKGFEYYVVENEKFTTILKSNNKTMTSFLIGELATKYNEIISSENK